MTDKIRWGILSTADINNLVIPAIVKDKRCEVVAIASRNMKKARESAAKFGIPLAYDGYDKLLADKEVDAVYISLPNSLHYEWCVKAAKAKKHILCEKPLATEVNECGDMIDEARRQGVFLQEGFMYRYHPQTLKVKELVKRKTVGNINYIYGVFSYSYFKAYGDNAFTNYRTNPELGGGCLWDIGSYVVNYLRYLADSEPLEVFGRAERLLNYRVDGIFCGSLKFPGQILAQFECSYMQTQRSVTEMYGDEGNLRVPYSYCLVWDSHEEPVTLDLAGKKSAISIETTNAYERELSHFCDCVINGATRLVPLEDALNNVKTLVALHQSAESGQPIKMVNKF